MGSDAAPEYSLRHPDPALPSSRNRYAVALYDSYNPEILFGEVLLIPEWSQQKVSAEEIRLNSGIPPPPQPVLPSEFIIQLYNPDQQVIVRWHAGTFFSAEYWEFEMPQQSFRQPSTSALDRTQSDPTASANTPKLGFKWKKDGKLSKDYVCSLSEKSTNPDGSKRRNREPDITVALFRHYKEITVYEPNLTRVDLEDAKGFEVVLLLGAVVIREVYSSNLRETFNLHDTEAASSAAAILPSLTPRRGSREKTTSPPTTLPPTASSAPTDSRPPPTDPRTQWELDAEAARLKKSVEREAAEQRRLDAAETKRVKKMLEDETRKERERQKEIDRETDRLKKIYGKEERKSFQQLQQQQTQSQNQNQNQNQNIRPPAVPQRHSVHAPFYNSPQPHHQQQQHQQQQQPVTAYPPAPFSRPHSASPAPYIAQNLRPQQGSPNLAPPPGSYGYPPPQMSGAQQPRPQMGNFSSASGPSPLPPSSQSQQQHQHAPKKSFWRMKGSSEDTSNARLQKQRSTVF